MDDRAGQEEPVEHGRAADSVVVADKEEASAVAVVRAAVAEADADRTLWDRIIPIVRPEYCLAANDIAPSICEVHIGCCPSLECHAPRNRFSVSEHSSSNTDGI